LFSRALDFLVFGFWFLFPGVLVDQPQEIPCLSPRSNIVPGTAMTTRKEGASFSQPARYRERRRGLFSTGPLLGCHEEVMVGLEKGKHGSSAGQGPEKHKMCLACHDPHDQAPIKKMSPLIRPSPRPRAMRAATRKRKNSLLLSAEDEACMSCHRGFNLKKAWQPKKSRASACTAMPNSGRRLRP